MYKFLYHIINKIVSSKFSRVYDKFSTRYIGCELSLAFLLPRVYNKSFIFSGMEIKIK